MKIRIGTRGSPLALAQTKIVQSQIKCESEVITVITTGDKKQSAGEGIARDKKDWIFELEQNLLNQKIDIAIHSAKDVPVDIALGTKLLPILKRENPADILISKFKLGDRFETESLRIGTSSLRRTAQLKLFNENLITETIRGNINTRINRLGTDFDGIVLAEAGLKRLGITGLETIQLDLEQFIPASNQGILVAQIRSGDKIIEDQLNLLTDTNTKIAFEVERLLVQLLEADCHSALGVYCCVNSDKVFLNSTVFSIKSDKFINCQMSSNIAEYKILGSEVAKELLVKGATDYLKGAV